MIKPYVQMVEPEMTPAEDSGTLDAREELVEQLEAKLVEQLEAKREAWEKTSGMRVAVDTMQAKLRESGDLPDGVKIALTQGAEECIARYKDKLSNLGIVCALFITVDW